MNPYLPNQDSPFFKSIPDDIEPLFHYTDAGGLVGMVQYKSLWLTSIHYQNDSQEYYYAFDLVKEVLDEYYPGLIPYDFYSRERTSTAFTFSLSEKRDSLSQWRGYCPNGGFALSFNREQINEFIIREGMLVAKCIYDKQKQKDFIINNVIGFSPEYYLEKLEIGKSPHFYIDPLIHYFPKRLFNIRLTSI